MTTTFEQFLAGWRDYIAENPSQRLGQTLFNYAYEDEATRALASRFTGSDIDPFYLDTRVRAFLQAIEIFLP